MSTPIIRQSNKIECTCLECGIKFLRCRAKVLSRAGGMTFCGRVCRYKSPHPRRSVEERFWEKVAKLGPNECWLWLGGTASKGYGSFSTLGKKRQTTSSRIAFELVYGKIPQGLCVLHKCDNPPCTNPNHLFLGTQRDNMQDAISKGRFRFAPNGLANRIKTHCKHGHEFTPENTYKYQQGRGCKKCRYSTAMEAQRIRRAKQGINLNPL